MSLEDVEPTNLSVIAAGPLRRASRRAHSACRTMSDSSSSSDMSLRRFGARDPPDAAVLRRARREERALPVEQAELADEAPRTHVREHLFAHPAQRVADHLDLARFDEDQVVVAVSGAEEVVTRRDVLGLAAEREQTRPLRVGQRRRLDRIEFVSHR